MECCAPPRENLVLIGFMGTGKSTIGRKVAAALRFEFVDVDGLLVSRERRPIAQIFATRGEAAFRVLETEALRSLTTRARCVIATGGGAVVRPENRPLLRQIGLVVCLTASEEVVFERVSRNKRRPLLRTPDPRATVRELLQERAGAYQEVAQVLVDTTELQPSQVVQTIVEEARRRLSWSSSA